MTTRRTNLWPEKLHRHGVRFSLRTMLVLTTALAVWFGTMGRSAHIQKAAVKRVREVGGEVHYAFQYDLDGNLQANAEHWAPKWLRDSLGEDYFMTAVDVVLPSTREAGKYYEVDATLEHLTRLKGLTGLTIKGQHLTDKGLEVLGRFANLARLNIRSTWVTDSGIRHIGQLTQLKHLSLNVPRISDAGIEHLSANSQLESLTLYGGRFSGEGLAHLASLSALRHLSLHGRHGVGEKVNDEALKYIAQLTNLEHLSLSNIIMTDFGLSQLKKMANLKSVSLPRRSVDKDAADSLKQSLRNVKLTPVSGFGGVVRSSSQ